MKRTVAILISLVFLLTSCTLQLRNESVITNSALDCNNAPPGTQLQCQVELNKAIAKILNDAGKVLSVDEIESTGRCSRYAVTVEYGQENAKNKRMTRTHNISVCSGSFFSYLWNNIEISAASLVMGFFAGWAARGK